MSRRKRLQGRDVNGILLLDKPCDISSNGALQVVKRLLDARKAGHTGSLDPLASGLLPICLGEATKMSAYLLNADKHYWTECKLGQVTSTGDAEGEVIATHPVPVLTEEAVRAVLATFVGQIEQIPPMHSAIKQNGQPLYKLAHQGIVVERAPRQIEIFSIGLLELDGDRLAFEVHCSKGTYIRTLAEDIGAKLGCGAHVSGLRRLQVATFDIEDAIGLDQLRELVEEQGPQAADSLLLPADYALEAWPQMNLSEDVAFYLKQGQPVLVPRAPTDGLVRLYHHGLFLGVGEILDDGRVAPRRLVREGG